MYMLLSVSDFTIIHSLFIHNKAWYVCWQQGMELKKIMAITLENLVKIRLFLLFTAKFKVTQKFHYTSTIKNKTGKYLTTSFYY